MALPSLVPGSRRQLLVAAIWCYVIAFVTSSTPANQETASSGKDSRGLFSPRMDYDEWTPLGRGDPLKNDPTYVYVPPVLERVHYWVDPSSRAPESPAPGTMPLGQSSMEVPVLRSTHKTTEATAESRLASFVDPFLKFIDGPKFTSTPQQHYYHNQYVMQSPYYQHQHMYHPKPRPSFQQREPYTMLVPPPLQAAVTFSAPTPSPSTTTKTTVEIGKGNLIYHTSTVSDWVEGKTQLATLAAASNQVTWKMAPTTSTTRPTTTLKEVEPKMELPPPIEDMGPLLASLLKNEWTTTTMTPPNIITVTTVPSLTTDPLFSHYKQPAEPMRGPMYLIIQGHSKVKTYGASNAQSFHGIPLQETNDIHQEGEGEIDRSGRRVGADEDYEEEDEERTTLKNKEEKATKRKKRQLEIDDLIPLNEAGLLLEEFLADQSEGSGIGALLAEGLSSRSDKRTT